MPDYKTLAGRLMELQTQLHRVPIRQNLSALDQGTLFLLNHLYQHSGTAHPKELSRGMSVSSARVVTLLNHPEKRGLVQRHPDPEDSRQVLVTLTDAVCRIIRQKREEIWQTVTEAFEELGPADAAAYLRIQETIVRNFHRRPECRIAVSLRMERRKPRPCHEREAQRKGPGIPVQRPAHYHHRADPERHAVAHGDRHAGAVSGGGCPPDHRHGVLPAGHQDVHDPAGAKRGQSPHQEPALAADHPGGLCRECLYHHRGARPADTG